MSYRNPQIVQPAKVGEIYGAGIAQLGKSISQGIDAYALKQEKIRKEQEAELKKQQNLYNQVDFEKAKMSANFTQKTRDYQLSSQLKPIADNAIKNYGDAKIALLNETNPAIRAELNKKLQNSYSTLINAEAYVKALQGDIGKYISINNAQEIGITKGIAATGADAIINQEFMQNISAMSDGGTIKMNQLEDGSIDLTAYRKDGSEIRTLNSAKYLQSGNSLIYDIPATDVEFLKDVDKQILTNKGNIKKEFLSDPKSRIIKTDAGSFNQFYETVDVDAIVKASSSTLVGQVAAYNAMTAQQKEDVWANQLGENRSEALTATDEDIAAAYQNLLVQSLKEQDAFDNFDGKLVSVGGMTKITPPTSPKPGKPTVREIKAENMANLISSVPSVFKLKLNPAGVPTPESFNAKIEIPEVTNPDTGKKEKDDKEFKDNIESLGFNVIDVSKSKEDDTIIGYDIEMKGKTSGTYKLDFNDLPTIKEFYNELLIISGYDPKEAQDVNKEILNILTIRGFEPTEAGKSIKGKFDK